MAELLYDQASGIQILNETDVDTDQVFRAFSESSPELAAMVRWTNDTMNKASRDGGLFDRDRFVTPVRVYDQIRVARDAAATDDVVSGVVESSEALAFTRMSIDCDGNEDEADIWNQIAADMDLDSRLREMWREDFTISQVTVATWWGTKNYRVGGKNPQTNVKRKKTYLNLRVPLGLSVIDPMKVVPVGNSMFNQDQLAYVADRSEVDIITATLTGHEPMDEVIRQLIVGPYEPGTAERQELMNAGCPTENLYLMNPRNVWRHTSTRPQYRKFPNVRMVSIMEVLDLKHQLRAMDRAVLIGSTNFIILVKKGSDQHPAKPAEITNLQSNVRTLARVPIIVGDHRLAIEIVTPKNDNTLQPDRYNGLDARITARLFQILMTGNFCLSRDHDVLVRRRGWVPIDLVKEGDEVASFQTENGTMVWAVVTDTPQFAYEGPMFDGPWFCATPNHRMPVREPGIGNPWQFTGVADLGTDRRIAGPCGLLPGDENTMSPEEMELYGWWIALGQGRCGDETVFYAVDELVHLLTRMGIESRVVEGRIYAAWVPDHPVGREPHRRFVPRFFFDECNLDRLLVGLLGREDVGDWTYETPSSHLAEDLQEIGVRLGLYVTTAGTLTGFRVCAQQRADLPTRGAEVDEIDYAGTVYCLTVPDTGTFLVRHNGRVHITGNSAGAKGDDSIKLAKFLAKGIENRRHMLRRSIERNVLRPAYVMNDQLTVVPKLRFHPKRVALDFDAGIASFLMDLRDRGDLSRESILEELDFDQEQEFLRRQLEAEKYDSTFQTVTPWGPATPAESPEDTPDDGTQDQVQSSPPKLDPRTGGRNLGGNRRGGGAAPGTGQGQAPRNPAKTSDGGPAK